MQKIFNERNGLAFIAYKGNEFQIKDIENALNKRCPLDFMVKSQVTKNVKIAKMVYNLFYVDTEPYRNDNIISVSGYIHSEMKEALKHFRGYGLIYDAQVHLLTNYLYKDINVHMFKELGNYLDFCSVIYDKQNDELVAGVSTPTSKYTHLYYGYTKENNEIMYSNDKEVLSDFCNEIFEMDSNTYVKNGVFYNLNEEVIDKNIIVKEESDIFSDKLNEILNKYLNSLELKNKIKDNINKQIDKETQKQILLSIRDSIKEFNLNDKINNALKDKLEELIKEYTKKLNIPVSNIIKLNDVIISQTTGGFYHEKFEQILRETQLDEPIMLVGPAGSGKNVAVSQVAEALGLKMYYTNNASNEFKLTGFIDAGGNYRETEFYKAFKNGGLFFLDEIDNSDPSALIVINSAIANGYMAFPHETIDKNPNFRIVTAGNTWGKGINTEYIGRQTLDASTLDRFDTIFFDYDKNLEKSLYPNEEVLEFMWEFRNAVYKTRIQHIVSTRGIGKVYRKEINGVPVEDTLTINVVKNLSQDDINTIIGNMKEISSNNKYYKGLKNLKLER